MMSNDTYLYLILTIPFVVFSVVAYYTRKDLRYDIRVAALVGAIAGILSEVWYFKDYWSPTTVTGVFWAPIEDILVGAGLMISLRVSYLLLRNNKLEHKYRQQKNTSYIMFVVGLVLLVSLNYVFHMNSLLVSNIIAFAIAIVILFLRKDLIKSAIFNTLSVSIVAFLTYIVMFKYMAPQSFLLSDFYFLDNSVYNINFLGNNHARWCNRCSYIRNPFGRYVKQSCTR